MPCSLRVGDPASSAGRELQKGLRTTRRRSPVGTGGGDGIVSAFSEHCQQVAAYQAADAGLGGGARRAADGTRETPCGFPVLGLRRAWAAARP